MKEKIINQIIDIEGGHVNNPNDSGGETNYGITIDVARKNGYYGSMHHLPRQIAFNIYADKYWNALKADHLLKLSENITEEVVDTGVNMGVYRSAEFLQRSLNVFNKRGTLYDDIKVDGVIGANTLNALRIYLQLRSESVMIKALNSLQGAYYIELSERREKDEEFTYGWLRTRV